MKNLDKIFDTDDIGLIPATEGEKEKLKAFIRQREKELINKWEAAITYSDDLEGYLDKKVMDNHFNLVKKELSHE